MFPTATKIGELQNSVGESLQLFIPELIVCAGIVILLLARLARILDRVHLGGVAVVTLVVALFVAGYQVYDDVWGKGIFAGMLVSDPFAGLVRSLVLLASLITVFLTQLTGIPDRVDSSDFHVLLLGGTLGMMLMGSANHLLMVFIAVEMASLPGYALAGFLKGKKTGSEAALKYVVYGAGASGVMLYGITLLAGTFGSGYLPDIATGVLNRGFDLPVLAGFALLFVGLGFKLAAVPFHFWCPDVFEGAAAEVAGFLSVASKSAAIALTLRILLTLQERIGGWAVAESLGLLVGVIAAITVTFGNLAAFSQTNLKRLLAYSTIAHAGYMLLAVGLCYKSEPSETGHYIGAAAILYYLAAYIVMNLGAFAVVALVRNATGSENMIAFRGLVRRSPLLGVTMTIFLLSLLGLPPLAGFAGKFQVFAAVYDAGRAASGVGHTNLGVFFYVLLAVGAVNTAVSAYYYLRIARAMLLEEPDTSEPARATPAADMFLVVLAVALFAVGIIWNPITQLAGHATTAFK
ncbi:MAG TPA: NADH-quinone oxidoreductase subunit N [Gemmata sp.]|nr:NADH-quinone oxidoreductase subunit N [Gemmata sp.]